MIVEDVTKREIIEVGDFEREPRARADLALKNWIEEFGEEGHEYRGVEIQTETFKCERITKLVATSTSDSLPPPKKDEKKSKEKATKD